MTVKKTTTKKAPAKKVAATKTAAKKTVAKKVAAKAAPAKKAVETKVPPPKAAASPLTTVVARVDVGFGNTLFIRGEGAGLTWTVGKPMVCAGDAEWTWATRDAGSGLVFKFLINDEIWSHGEDNSVAAGGTSITSPSFF